MENKIKTINEIFNGSIIDGTIWQKAKQDENGVIMVTQTEQGFLFRDTSKDTGHVIKTKAGLLSTLKLYFQVVNECAVIELFSEELRKPA